MKHIVAIGGGEIGRPGKPIETTSIDEQIIKLSKKKQPNVLFLPTASDDSEDYCDIFKHHYEKRLGCVVKDLRLRSRPPYSEIKAAIEWADIIYVGGGNTLKMLTLWRKLGVDVLLKEAWERSVILCGLSAGAVCWFNGLSDSRAFTSKGKTWSHIKVRGLGLKDLFICPHFDTEHARQPALKHALSETRKVAVTIDNCAALEIKDDTFRVLASREKAGVNKAYWQDGKYVVKPVPASAKYRPLSELTQL